MPAKFIVMISDPEDPRRGEITVVDDPRTATHLVETLLEAGFQQERIRLFSGDQAEMLVSSRPVVSLVDEQPTPIRPVDEAITPPESARAEEEEAKEEVTPFVRDGVRFSSLFRAS